MLTTQEFIKRLRAIGGEDKEYTFNVTIIPCQPNTFGMDSVEIKVKRGFLDTIVVNGTSIENALLLLERQFQPPPTIVIKDGKKYMEVNVDGKIELMRIK